MGRELRRKEAKRNGKDVGKKEKLNTTESISIINLTRILIILIILCITTYLLSGIFVTKDIKWFSKNEKEEEEVTNSIRNRILAKDSLKQIEENYYIYYYDDTKEDTEITNIVDNLDETVYRVNLHDGFNSNFIGEPSGLVDKIEDLKVSDPTIIKVSSEKIVEFYSGKDQIQMLLK